MSKMFNLKPDLRNKRVYVNIRKQRGATNRGIRQGFYFLGRDLFKEGRRLLLEGPKTGRLYVLKINGRRRRHRASAPGEAPANFSGTLRRSIGYNIKGSDFLEFGYRKGQGADAYARALELDESGRLGGKRPALLKATISQRRNARKHFMREIRKAQRRA